MAVQYQEFTTPGTFTFTVPQGVASIIVECIGGGGLGGYADGDGISNYQAYGGGGGGGSYAKKTLSVIPGTAYTVAVANSSGGGGGFIRANTGSPSYFAFGATNLVYAQGGQGGENIQQASDDCRKYGLPGTGSTSLCIGDIVYRGGNGGGFPGDPSQPNRCGGTVSTTTRIGGGGKLEVSSIVNCDPEYSGPGGGGAGITGKGGDANFCASSAGGIGNSPGGNGGVGKVRGNNGTAGSNYGGGGSGGAIRKISWGTREGGLGGSGYVKISWETEDLSCRSLYTSLACCPIAIGCNVYSNPQLTTPAEDGYYWDGTKCWIVLNGIINSTGSCGTTTSTTTTTTTSPTAYFYTATQYSCPGCDEVGGVTVRSSTELTNGVQYSIADGYTYLIGGSTFGPSYNVDLTGAISGPSCFALCIT
jgi:hypothetical protein